MMSSGQNLVWAKAAVSYTKKALSTGPSNKLSNMGLRPLMCVNMMRGSASPMKKNNMYDFIRSWASRAQHFKCGNCAEHAAVAFVYLKDKGILPIHYMALVGKGDHGFVVIGRKTGSPDGNLASWGPNAIVCDPYKDKCYPVMQNPSLNQAKTVWSFPR